VTRSRILVFLPLPPYPLRATGLSVRYLPIISDLATRHDVHLALLDGPAVNHAVIEGLRPVCARLDVVEDPRLGARSVLRRASSAFGALLPWTLPAAFTIAGGSRITEQLRAVSGGRPYDVVLAAGSVGAPYLRGIPTGRFVIDFIDSPYVTHKRRVHGDAISFPRWAYELWKIKRWEGRMIRESDAAIYISSVDASAVRDSRTPADRQHVVPNGLSVEGYSARVEEGIRSPSIGFLGNMSYPPNVEAVRWLFERVFRPLRTSLPGLSMIVIGREPDPSIRALAAEPGIVVTGDVPEIWPYVNAVDVLALPLLRGAGLKNKLIEALYARRAVVTTSLGAEGVGAESGRDLEVRDDETGFREAVSGLIQDAEKRRRMGDAGRAHVERAFAWPELLTRFEAALLGGRGHGAA